MVQPLNDTRIHAATCLTEVKKSQRVCVGGCRPWRRWKDREKAEKGGCDGHDGIDVIGLVPKLNKR